VVRLPNGFLCYEPPADAPPVSPLPAGTDRPVTFGCFHFPAKINPGVVRLWSRVLHAVPGSSIRFVYRSYDRPALQDRLRGLFAQGGIGADRSQFRGHLPRAEYLREFHGIDLMLDPFPFSGGTVTCDALWMGVPVVTLPGRTFAGRQSQSHLSAIGLPDLVASDADAYVAIIRDLCGMGSRARLIDLRATLRQRMVASPLCDTGRFARTIEAVFRALWRARCTGSRLDPGDIAFPQ
jgi:predicted O-linked N-acetylglucosamine transferase (SPINDLY family)